MAYILQLPVVGAAAMAGDPSARLLAVNLLLGQVTQRIRAEAWIPNWASYAFLAVVGLGAYWGLNRVGAWSEDWCLQMVTFFFSARGIASTSADVGFAHKTNALGNGHAVVTPTEGAK